MTYFSIGDVSDGQFPIGVLRRLSDASPTGALREGVLLVEHDVLMTYDVTESWFLLARTFEGGH